MTCNGLEALSSKLYGVLQSSFLHRPSWIEMRANLEILAHSLNKYSNLLREKSKVMKRVHDSTEPWRSLSKGLDVFYLTPNLDISSDEIQNLSTKVLEAGPYSYIKYVPYDSKRRYHFIKQVRSGLGIPTILLVHSPGNKIGNSHFLWYVPDHSLNEALKNSQTVIEEIKEKIPVFHSRLMRKEFINKFGRVSSTVKPAVLRYIYHDMTGDSSSSDTSSQEEIDFRVKQAIEMEDPEIVTDLRQLNSGAKEKYDVFWIECGTFLEEEVGTAVDERRHGTITHIATAKCPENTPIPSIEWLRLQFWPKTPSAKSAMHYIGRFKVRYRVQQRQLRKEHPDSHYAAEVFKYQREYAVRMREYSSFILS